jgi:predicted NAD-dependent protein-ADP-ribosyltransferase YbiA (DUF1768 family)
MVVQASHDFPKTQWESTVAHAPRNIFLHSKFWGAVYDEKSEKWVGQNHLGKLWMELRSNLQRSSAPVSPETKNP